MDTVSDAQHDLLGRVDTSQLYQPFCERLNGLLNACVERGAIYVATSALRSYAAQDALYARGRSAAPIGPGHIVTKARGGFSPHNFGVAVDFARHAGADYEGKLSPDYRDQSYAVLAEEAERVGLEAGLHWPGNFKDSPHIQLPLKNKGVTWAMMRAWYSAGGYPEVFRQLDARAPW